MSETRSEKRRRLRWLTLAEVIGVSAVAISAASYWDSRREHTVAEAPAPAKPLLLTATVAGEGDSLTLRPARGDATVQTQTLIFPAGVRADTVETTGNPRIDAEWLAEGLRNTVDDDIARPPRLPVGIVTSFEVDGDVRSDAALYDIGYAFHDRVLRGRAVELEGITLVRRMPTASLKAAVEARWKKALPPPVPKRP
jgi:hypothetical protein